MRKGLAAILVLTAALAGCIGQQADPGSQAPDPDQAADEAQALGLVIETRLGTVTLALHPDLAPKTVEHIAGLAQGGWYNGTTFYRTLDDFVIQGGPQDEREPADTVPLEPGGYFAAGTLGLARDLEEDSGTSHIFITEYPAEHLHEPSPEQSAAGSVYGAFTAFGQVVDGMDVVRAIAELPQEEAAPGVDDPSNDRPADPPEMTVRVTTLDLPAKTAEELPYRTWGRERAPPYRISVDSPGLLPVGSQTWLRVFVEEEGEAAPHLAPSFQVTDAAGDTVEVQATALAVDPNVHRLELTFPAPGGHTLTVLNGERELASFPLEVEGSEEGSRDRSVP